MIKPTFLFHITCDIHDVKFEGVAEIPGKNGKIWYSHVTITPINRDGDLFETRNSFYKIIDHGDNPKSKEIFSSPNECYLGPLRGVVRYVDERTGSKMIDAEDPYIDGEFLIGEIYEETDEWIDIIIRSRGLRRGHFRFLKFE